MAKKQAKQEAQNYNRQAISVILIGIGFIVFLAVISFSRLDNPNLDIENNSIVIKNWLGPLGAALASPLMNYTLGYPVIVFPLLIIFIGVLLYRGQRIDVYWKLILIILAWSVLLSVGLAMSDALKYMGKIREYYPSGWVGGTLASRLVIYTGRFGSVLILAMLTMALAVLSLKLDVAAVLGNLAAAMQSVLDRFREKYENWQQERAEKIRLAGQVKMQKAAERESKIPPVTEISAGKAESTLAQKILWQDTPPVEEAGQE
jgi:DNA segregation ATPase FtsK/SpoIIIE, S-DNA-T family